MPLSLNIVDSPSVPIRHLDALWFQVAGTRCNLTCSHCFISCSPHNHSFGFLDLATVECHLAESIPLGVKEYYFTGGEPFLNPDMVAILERTLAVGPATVLTNGTVLRDDWLHRLRAAADASIYSLEFRVSLDGACASDNDPIRGEGTFARILAGVKRLLDFGFLPILTVTKTRDDQDDAELFSEFVAMLKAIGYTRPRVKILPTLRLGAEASRQRGYNGDERVTDEMLADFDMNLLVCSNSRTVTDRGVFTCPILIESPVARLGATLAGSLRPAPLSNAACYTCWQHGALCSNVTPKPE